MDRFSICALVVMTLANLAAAQAMPEPVVRLERQLKHATGTRKIDLMNELADKYGSISPAKCVELSQHALDEAIRLRYKKGEANALLVNADCRDIVGKTKRDDEIKEVGFKALDIFQSINDQQGIAKSYALIGYGYRRLSDLDSALTYGLKALELAQKIDDKPTVAGAYRSIGVTYANLNNWEKSLEYFLKSAEVGEQIDGYLKNLNIHSNIGIIYGRFDQHAKALPYHTKSLEISTKYGVKTKIVQILQSRGNALMDLEQFDKALTDYENALRLAKETNYDMFIKLITSNIGQCHRRLGNLEKALEYLHPSLESAQRDNNDNAIFFDSMHLGFIYTKQKKFDLAYKYLNLSLSTVPKLHQKYNYISIYQAMYMFYEAKGDFKNAYKYHTMYHDAYKNHNDEKNVTKLSELQVKYDTLKEKRENEILARKNQKLQSEKALLAKENQIKEVTRNALIVSLALVLIILGLLFQKYRYLFSFWKKEKYIGQFRLMEKIGAGGMGTVYRAHSVRDKNDIAAIKVMRDDRGASDESTRRFKNEALITDRLNHPNIVKVLERGEYKGRLYIAMEFLDGITLRQKMDREGPLDVLASISIIRQVAQVLELVHRKKIIHRDLKPGNIMLVKSQGRIDIVKLLDFGVAKANFQTTLTRTGNILGSFRYMSPEQMQGHVVTSASDIYSIGVVFYEMLTNRTLFSAKNPTAFKEYLSEKMPIEPKEIRPEVPNTVNTLIMDMLAKQLSTRPSAEAIVERLREYEDTTSIDIAAEPPSDSKNDTQTSESPTEATQLENPSPFAT